MDPMFFSYRKSFVVVFRHCLFRMFNKWMKTSKIYYICFYKISCNEQVLVHKYLFFKHDTCLVDVAKLI